MCEEVRHEHHNRTRHRDHQIQAASAGVVGGGIVKSYKRVWPLRRGSTVLRGADMQLRAGEVVGLGGENGSGKSSIRKVRPCARRAATRSQNRW